MKARNCFYEYHSTDVGKRRRKPKNNGGVSEQNHLLSTSKMSETTNNRKEMNAGAERVQREPNFRQKCVDKMVNGVLSKSSKGSTKQSGKRQNRRKTPHHVKSYTNEIEFIVTNN